jgi:DNA topoisomerase-1
MENLSIDPEGAADSAGLIYVTPDMPGIRRMRQGEEFVYIAPTGDKVTDERTIARIRALSIPPAWEDAWICPVARGHLQAVGTDRRGRRQYRYHAAWRTVRDRTKFHRLIPFGEALPVIRERVSADLQLPALPREKVIAAILRLLERTHMRIGNEEYARENKSFGLTTLRGRHAEVHGAAIRFRFRGKSGVEHEIDIRDKRLARIVARCHEIPGQQLFEYLDANGRPQPVDSSHVNGYLKIVTGEDFTAKDFRTWAGTVLAASALLRNVPPPEAETERRHTIVEAVKHVSRRLGNTPAVCRSYYIHPVILDAYGRREFDIRLLEETKGLHVVEGGVLRFLKRHN